MNYMDRGLLNHYVTNDSWNEDKELLDDLEELNEKILFIVQEIIH